MNCKDLEGSSHDTIEVSYSLLEGLRRTTKNSDRLVGAWVEIQIENLSPTHLEHYLWSILFCKTVTYGQSTLRY
jgi:hypothetical protein